MVELENRKVVKDKEKIKKINKEKNDIKRWFSRDYVHQIANVEIAKYYGYKPEINLSEIYDQAYKKENRLRELEGREKLPKQKRNKIF